MILKRSRSAVPGIIEPYLWDMDKSKVDLETNPLWLISRILDRGNLEAVSWVKNRYGDTVIKDSIKKSSEMSLKSASFWALVYNIPIKELKCFQTPYQNTRRTLWPY